MDRDRIVPPSRWKRIMLAALTCAWLASPGLAAADDSYSGTSSRPGANADAVLYEVSENMYLVDGDGNAVSSPALAVYRKADAALQGWAKLGTPLCPSSFLITNPYAKTCSVTAKGLDNISLATGKGTVSGTFAVVIQDDNPVDAPEYVAMNGVFSGDMDLSMRPLGKIRGTFTAAGSTTPVPFCGTFRLPFRVNSSGTRGEWKSGFVPYYLSDDGRTPFVLSPREFSLLSATVRLEVNFSNCH
jgi:hypothetical protein